MSKKITFIDKTFWITESKANPKHVASLQLLQMPKGAAEDYVDKLYQELKGFSEARSPFNCKVVGIWRFPLKLSPVDKMDMDYHVQLHELDDLNDRSALHKFTAQLHEVLLDRDKPLWQFHIIKCADSRKFAIYVKVHHMYGDGITLVRWFQAGYLPEVRTDGFVPVWAADLSRKRNRPKPSVFKRYTAGIWQFIVASKDLIWILLCLLAKLLRINRNYMPVPFSGTKTLLTGQVKSGRVVSSLDIDFLRVKDLAKRARASANEILLCSFDIGVHRFLKDHGHTFDKALYTNMPINLRKPGDQTSGNKIAIVPVRLAYGKKDPYLRLRQIIENHRVVIRASKKAHPAAFSYYTVLIQSFALLFEMLHVSDWVKPIGNILISNVPGPNGVHYLKDSELLACYPISTMTPGGGVNITLLTYNGVANVGLVCCDHNIKSLEPMAQYCKEAFDMLEKCIDDPALSIDDIGEQAHYEPHPPPEDAILEQAREDGVLMGAFDGSIGPKDTSL